MIPKRLLFFLLWLLLSSFAIMATSATDVDVMIGYQDDVPLPTPDDTTPLTPEGGTVKHVFQRIHVIAATVPDTQLDYLRSLPQVTYVELDEKVSLIEPVKGSVRML